jgi:NAD(P)-dependent dehydrogenase (short-subunit alcohol dehydrogenase family)
MTDFEDRVVVIVGAAGALGDAMIGAFLAAGATVRGLDRVVPSVSRGDVEYRTLDVLDDDAVADALSGGPPPWAVVNVVGGFAAHSPLTDIDPGQLLAQLQLNLTTAALVTKHALRRMQEIGEGRIVHTASRAARVTTGSGFAYSVSKLAVLHLVEMAAAETRGTPITVNAVVPSIIDTPANRVAMPSSNHDLWPKADQVAAVYVFLASPAAALISGAAIPVYGLS